MPAASRMRELLCRVSGGVRQWTPCVCSAELMLCCCCCHCICCREAPLRLSCPNAADSAGSCNIEFKPFDGTANPYIGLAAIIAAGMRGTHKSCVATAGFAEPLDIQWFACLAGCGPCSLRVLRQQSAWCCASDIAALCLKWSAMISFVFIINNMNSKQTRVQAL
jgi:hypothetical protein